MRFLACEPTCGGQMQRCSVFRVLDQLCHRVGRDRAYGAIIWKLKEPLE
jgi:hypothetical protein